MKFTVVLVAAQSLWALSRWYEAFQREHPEVGVELTAYFIAAKARSTHPAQRHFSL